MAGAIPVRRAQRDDLRAVLALLEQLHPGEHDLPSIDDARTTWDVMLGESGRTVLVAEVDGVVCGTADLFVVANLTRHGRPWSIVENVVVDGSRRREGVGRALMAAVEGAARAAGCYKVQLLSANGRDAHRFYESLGFEPRAQGFRRYF